MVKKPQLVPPPPMPEYWAHHRVLSQGRALAGVCDSIAGTTMSAAITLVSKRICKPPLVVFQITPCPILIHRYRRRAQGPTSRICAETKNKRNPLSRLYCTQIELTWPVTG